jgi:hypothetical protein
MILIHLDLPREQRTVFAIVIEKPNLDRMKEGDPVTLEAKAHGGVLPVPAFPANLSLLIAYLEDASEFYQLAEKRDPALLLEYLERHRQWHPEVDGVEHTRDLWKQRA